MGYINHKNEIMSICIHRGSALSLLGVLHLWLRSVIFIVEPAHQECKIRPILDDQNGLQRLLFLGRVAMNEAGLC